MSFRSCEILSDLDPRLKQQLEDQLRELELWKNYDYTRGVLDPAFARVEHLSPASIIDYQRHFTSAYPSHFSQNKLTQVLTEVMLDHDKPTEVLFGSAYKQHIVSSDGLKVEAIGPDGQLQMIECEALVGADGVGSQVRKNIGVALHGQKSKYFLFSDTE